jgi:NitT/TauT family transport system substrate-binding protein
MESVAVAGELASVLPEKRFVRFRLMVNMSMQRGITDQCAPSVRRGYQPRHRCRNLSARSMAMITLSENFRALFYTPFYAAHAIGAYEAEKVEVRLRDSPDPARTAADLRAGRIDVMWGGPLRVLLTHAADSASDVVCFCDVVARDPFFVIGREPRPDFQPRHLLDVRFGSVSEVPTPWLCLQDDIRRDGADPAMVARTNGPSMAENSVALTEGRLDAIQVFQPHAEQLLQSGAGYLWSAAASRGLTAYTTLVTRRAVLTERRDELAAMVRAMYRSLKWLAATPGAEVARALASFFPDVPAPIYAAAIDRYRSLDLYGLNPITRREGVERLHAAMRSGGALDRDVSFENVVDNSLAEEAVARG